jgi:hypothetical protein
MAGTDLGISRKLDGDVAQKLVSRPDLDRTGGFHHYRELGIGERDMIANSGLISNFSCV